MSEKLTWTDLRTQVALRAGVSEKEAARFLDALSIAIREGLKEEGMVRINGLGTFNLKAVAPRKSVNIQTGEPFTIEGYNKLGFTAEVGAKESINHPPVSEEVKAAVASIIDPIQKIGVQASEILDILDDLNAMDEQNEQVTAEPTLTPAEETPTEVPIDQPTLPNPIEHKMLAEAEKVKEEVEKVKEEVKEEVEKVKEEVKEEGEKVKEKAKKVKETGINRPWLAASMTVLAFFLMMACLFLYAEYRLNLWVNGMHEKTAPPTQQESTITPTEPEQPEIQVEPELTEVQEAQPQPESAITPTEPEVQEETKPAAVAEPAPFPDLSKTLTTETMQNGSRLRWVAKKYYGEPDLWVFIYEANKRRYPNPNHIQIGKSIRVPLLSPEWRDLSNPITRQVTDSLLAIYEHK